MAATLAEQIESVQAAIAAVESGAQTSSVDGQSLTRADLQTLYSREQRLLNKIDRADRGRYTVAET